FVLALLCGLQRACLSGLLADGLTLALGALCGTRTTRGTAPGAALATALRAARGALGGPGGTLALTVAREALHATVVIVVIDGRAVGCDALLPPLAVVLGLDGLLHLVHAPVELTEEVLVGVGGDGQAV